eukprot:m.923378 g.923378  ORF g.923378 m.923378 type:complete len:727 (+) comp109472_c0_seq1:125-2305(+)
MGDIACLLRTKFDKYAQLTELQQRKHPARPQDADAVARYHQFALFFLSRSPAQRMALTQISSTVSVQLLQRLVQTCERKTEATDAPMQDELRLCMLGLDPLDPDPLHVDWAQHLRHDAFGFQVDPALVNADGGVLFLVLLDISSQQSFLKLPQPKTLDLHAQLNDLVVLLLDTVVRIAYADDITTHHPFQNARDMERARSAKSQLASSLSQQLASLQRRTRLLAPKTARHAARKSICSSVSLDEALRWLHTIPLGTHTDVFTFELDPDDGVDEKSLEPFLQPSETSRLLITLHFASMLETVPVLLSLQPSPKGKSKSKRPARVLRASLDATGAQVSLEGLPRVGEVSRVVAARLESCEQHRQQPLALSELSESPKCCRETELQEPQLLQLLAAAADPLSAAMRTHVLREFESWTEQQSSARQRRLQEELILEEELRYHRQPPAAATRTATPAVAPRAAAPTIESATEESSGSSGNDSDGEKKPAVVSSPGAPSADCPRCSNATDETAESDDWHLVKSGRAKPAPRPQQSHSRASPPSTARRPASSPSRSAPPQSHRQVLANKTPPLTPPLISPHTPPQILPSTVEPKPLASVPAPPSERTPPRPATPAESENTASAGPSPIPKSAESGFLSTSPPSSSTDLVHASSHARTFCIPAQEFVPSWLQSTQPTQSTLSTQSTGAVQPTPRRPRHHSKRSPQTQPFGAPQMFVPVPVYIPVFSSPYFLPPS